MERAFEDGESEEGACAPSVRVSTRADEQRPEHGQYPDGEDEGTTGEEEDASLDEATKDTYRVDMFAAFLA